jgi:hypothetical protein
VLGKGMIIVSKPGLRRPGIFYDGKEVQWSDPRGLLSRGQLRRGFANSVPVGGIHIAGMDIGTRFSTTVQTSEGVFAMHTARRVLPVLFFSVLLTVFALEVSQAATHVFKPEDHSVYVDQRDPDLNKSDKAGILTASTLNENARIVIHFDLGAWAPDPSEIVQAKLYLYHYRGGNYTGSRTLIAYPLTTGFDEAAATWNSPWTLPGGDYDNAFSASAAVPEAWENWVDWDVTDILKNRFSQVASFGLLIRDPVEDTPTDGPYVRFRSHRYADEFPAEIPYLEVVTTEQQIPTLTEWGMIIFGVTLLAFLTWSVLRRRPMPASQA